MLEINHKLTIKQLSCVFALLALIIWAFCTHAAFAQSPEEIELFNTLKGRFESQKEQAPIPVDDILTSLGHDGVTISCSCNHEGGATIKIYTELGAWDPPEGKENYNGFFRTGKAKVIQQKPKIVEIRNIVMFNAAKLKAKETLEFGRLDNDRIFYHEMLHGQLYINLIKDKMKDEEWCKEFCECKRDVPPPASESDDHKKIDPEEDGYLKNIATDAGFTVWEQKNVEEIAHGDGTFRIETGVEKEYDNSYGYPEEEKNIEWLRIVTENGKIVIYGKLHEPKKPGYFKRYIDPPGTIVIGAYSLSSPAAVGPNTQLILVSALALIVAAGYLLSKRKKVCIR